MERPPGNSENEGRVLSSCKMDGLRQVFATSCHLVDNRFSPSYTARCELDQYPVFRRTKSKVTKARHRVRISLPHSYGPYCTEWRNDLCCLLFLVKTCSMRCLTT